MTQRAPPAGIKGRNRFEEPIPTLDDRVDGTVPLPFSSDQSFLHYWCHKDALFVKNIPSREPPGIRSAWTVNRIEQPFVRPEGPVEPHGMVKTGEKTFMYFYFF